MTTDGSAADAVDVLLVADAYLAKPVDFERFTQIDDFFLALGRGLRQHLGRVR